MRMSTTDRPTRMVRGTFQLDYICEVADMDISIPFFILSNRTNICKNHVKRILKPRDTEEVQQNVYKKIR